MKKPNRIGINLFDEELKTLINASAKIFPITQEEFNNNLNPKNYEYGKLDKVIYQWVNSKWEYLVADDIDIDWVDVKNKPVTYPPSTHNHDDGGSHTHSNKNIIDTITQILIDGWNSATSHISDIIKHITNDERTLWNTVSNKVDSSYLENELIKKSNTTHDHNPIYSLLAHNHDVDYSRLGHSHDYSPTIHNHDLDYSKLGHAHDYSPSTHDHNTTYSQLTHNHDGAYPSKSYIDIELGKKSNLEHIHTVYEDDIEDIDTRLYIIENAEGHNHDNLGVLGNFEEINGKPYYNGTEIGGTSGETHTHSNKNILDTITQVLIDGWNSAVAHISDSIKHITSTERNLWNTVSNKSESTHNHDVSYSQLGHTHDYANSIHNHHDLYFTETEVNSLLVGKSDIGHNHDVSYSQLGHTHDYAESEHEHTILEITDFPTSLPANGGNADTVGGFTVGIDVPSNAKFTDTNTTYSVIDEATIDGGSSLVAKTISGARVKYIIDKARAGLMPIADFQALLGVPNGIVRTYSNNEIYLESPVDGIKWGDMSINPLSGIEVRYNGSDDNTKKISIDYNGIEWDDDDIWNYITYDKTSHALVFGINDNLPGGGYGSIYFPSGKTGTVALVEDLDTTVTSAINNLDSNNRLVTSAQVSKWDNIRTNDTLPFIVEVRTDDPVNPVLGRMWFRSDL